MFLLRLSYEKSCLGYRGLPDRERGAAAVAEADAATAGPSRHQAARLPQLRPRGSQVYRQVEVYRFCQVEVCRY